MKVLHFLLVLALTALLAGCGGGGGGDNQPQTSFAVDVQDDGAGFYHGNQANFVILGFTNGDPTYGKLAPEAIHAVGSSDIRSEYYARFKMSLGKPKYVNGEGIGVFDVRLTQGRLGTWSPSDPYDQWYVDGDHYALGYSPALGWTVWNASTTTYIGKLEDWEIGISVYLYQSGRSATLDSRSKPDDSKTINPKEALAKIAEKLASMSQ